VKRLLYLGLFFALQAFGVEKHSIPSLDGKQPLDGYWFAALAPGPRPAVISLHGCGGLLDAKGGLSRNRYRVAEYLNVEGMHMLALDSFTTRGIKSICETATRLRTFDHEERRADVYAAIRWLSQRPDVDRGRIAVVGYSNGGTTVLSVVDRTDELVRAQPLHPRAAVAFYPGCIRFNEMWNYEIVAPLLLMIGALDDWTAPVHCQRLQGKVRRAQKDALFEYLEFPGAHHGFDGYGPLQARTGLPTRTGTATVGGNPEARDKALRRMFEFLSETMGTPLSLSHEARFHGHRYAVPPASGFGAASDVAAVPLSETGRERYQYYLKQGAPKAFAITEKRGWFLRSDDSEAMAVVLQRCQRAKVRCWLYAVDDRVVWSPQAEARTDAGKLRRVAPPTGALSAAGIN
jgi:dienelactone hydrolase